MIKVKDLKFKPRRRKEKTTIDKELKQLEQLEKQDKPSNLD